MDIYLFDKHFLLFVRFIIILKRVIFVRLKIKSWSLANIGLHRAFSARFAF